VIVNKGVSGIHVEENQEVIRIGGREDGGGGRERQEMGDDPYRKTARKKLKRDGDYEIFPPNGRVFG
jgi:hypothetical protein